MNKKYKVVFCGTPDFSLGALEILANHPQIDLVKVITMPDRKAGRGHQLQSPAVAEFAKTHKLPLFQTANINKEEELLSELEGDGIDFFVVLAFAQFLGKRALELPKLGCFNIHTSLLPKYRGAAPIQYALLNGDKSSGVSIQKMVKKMDAGDLVHSKEIDLANFETGGLLYTRLKFQAALSLYDFIGDLLNDRVEYHQQDEEHVSFAPTLSKQDGFLDFKTESYETIYNKVRALKPWPGTWCFLGKKRLKVIEIEPSTKKLSPNEINHEMGTLEVGTTTDSIRLRVVQLEGKKVTEDFELLRGLENSMKQGNPLILNPEA